MVVTFRGLSMPGEARISKPRIDQDVEVVAKPHRRQNKTAGLHEQRGAQISTKDEAHKLNGPTSFTRSSRGIYARNRPDGLA